MNSRDIKRMLRVIRNNQSHRRIVVQLLKEKQLAKHFDDDPDDWITVNGNHIPVDEDDKPIGGQIKVFGNIGDAESIIKEAKSRKEFRKFLTGRFSRNVSPHNVRRLQSIVMTDWNRFKESEGGMDAVYIAEYPVSINKGYCVIFYNNGRDNVSAFCQIRMSQKSEAIDFIRKRLIGK